MKKIIIPILIIVGLLAPVYSANAATRVNSYYKKNGTYVNSYYRSDSNSVKYDNYSSKGNYNPYTGKKGYKSW